MKKLLMSVWRFPRVLLWSSAFLWWVCFFLECLLILSQLVYMSLQREKHTHKHFKTIFRLTSLWYSFVFPPCLKSSISVGEKSSANLPVWLGYMCPWLPRQPLQLVSFLTHHPRLFCPLIFWKEGQESCWMCFEISMRVGGIFSLACFGNSFFSCPLAACLLSTIVEQKRRQSRSWGQEARLVI